MYTFNLYLKRKSTFCYLKEKPTKWQGFWLIRAREIATEKYDNINSLEIKQSGLVVMYPSHLLRMRLSFWGNATEHRKMTWRGKKNLIFKFLTLVVIWKCSPIGANLPYDMKQSWSVQLVWLKEDGSNSWYECILSCWSKHLIIITFHFSNILSIKSTKYSLLTLFLFQNFRGNSFFG